MPITDLAAFLTLSGLGLAAVAGMFYLMWRTPTTRASDILVDHHCCVDGHMQIAVGEPCNWCGRSEPQP